MNVLRKWYRSGLVEPLVVALMLFMVVTGGLLLRARLTRPAGWFETLQTATGTYLGVYIVGHMRAAGFAPCCWPTASRSQPPTARRHGSACSVP